MQLTDQNSLASEEVCYQQSHVQKACSGPCCHAASWGGLTGAERCRQGAHHQGKRPVSSWYSIMPRLHMSASRPYSRLNTSAGSRGWNWVHWWVDHMIFAVMCSPEHVVPPACGGPDCSKSTASPDSPGHTKPGFARPKYLGQRSSTHLEPCKQVCPACWSACGQLPRFGCIQSQWP